MNSLNEKMEVMGLTIEDWKLAYFLYIDSNYEPLSLWVIKEFWIEKAPKTPKDTIKMSLLLIELENKYAYKEEYIVKMLERFLKAFEEGKAMGKCRTI